MDRRVCNLVFSITIIISTLLGLACTIAAVVKVFNDDIPSALLFLAMSLAHCIIIYINTQLIEV